MAYKFLIGHREVHQAFKWLWNCFCQPKHKVFFWLLLRDRLSTRNILKTKHMQLDSYNCVLCSLLTKETSNHIFLECPFAKECWNSIGITFQSNITITEAVLEIRSQSNHHFFMISGIMMSCAIWTFRNDFIFKNIQPDVRRVKEVFKKEIQLLFLRAKSKDSLIFDLWIQNLL